jgi:nonsense-mediated mRNA decay protein 3
VARFCVNCGIDESIGVPIIDNLCLKCYTKLREVVKVSRSIEIHTCGRCGAILIEGRWYYPTNSEEALEIVKKYIASEVRPGEDITIKNIHVDLLPTNYSSAHIRIELLIKNRYNYVFDQDTEIKWIKQLCPTCFRRAGRSFEAVVQIRFIHLDKTIEMFKDTIMKVFQDQIVEVEDIDNGFDLKVVSPGVARKIADVAKRYWNIVRVTESYGDVKRMRDGSRRAKLYISVRVINLGVGDYVVINNKAYTVVEVNDRTVIVVDSSGYRKSIDIENLLSSYQKSKSKHR